MMCFLYFHLCVSPVPFVTLIGAVLKVGREVPGVDAASQCTDGHPVVYTVQLPRRNVAHNLVAASP